MAALIVLIRSIGLKMKNTRASRKAKRIAETIKELSDCKQALKLSQKAINDSCAAAERLQYQSARLLSELEEYKAWEKQVAEIVGQYSIFLKTLTPLAVSEMPENLQLSLSHDLNFLSYGAGPQPDSFIRKLLINKLTIISKYDQLKRGVAVIARMGMHESALYVSMEEIRNIPLSWLIDRISNEIARHLASNLKSIVRN